MGEGLAGVTSTTDITGAPRSEARRIAIIDVARGVAILAMIVYHFAWDLGFLRFIRLDVTAEPGWIVFQKLIVGSFIFLTGVSLVLAHQSGIRWRPFWKRFALILGAAVLVTGGTYLFSPETFVYFGVLHAIALFSLMGLPFLRAPLFLVLAFAAMLIIMPLVVSQPLFGEKIWSWIGLWDVPPPTEDLVPVFPWLGVALAGVIAARWALASGLAERLRAVSTSALPLRALALAGRWSLVIYLLHQPILIGVLSGIAAATGVSEIARAEDFVASCEASCSQSAGEGAYCTRYCACSLERVATENLWAMLEAQIRTQEQEDTLIELTNQCAAQALEQGPEALDPQAQ